MRSHLRFFVTGLFVSLAFAGCGANGEDASAAVAVQAISTQTSISQDLVRKGDLTLYRVESGVQCEATLDALTSAEQQALERTLVSIDTNGTSQNDTGRTGCSVSGGANSQGGWTVITCVKANGDYCMTGCSVCWNASCGSCSTSCGSP